MLLAPRNLVHETTTSTGTGNVTLSAVNGRVRFSDATYGFGTGGVDVFYYFLTHRSVAEWEIGTGHMLDANTLVRDTVLESSNANALVSFSNGTKDATNDIPADQQTFLQTLTASTVDFYIDGATGSDITGDGSIGAPWETIQFGINEISTRYRLTASVLSLVLHVADAVYDEFVSIVPLTGSPNSFIGLEIRGESYTGTIIRPSTAAPPNVFGVVQVTGAVIASIANIDVDGTVSGTTACAIYNGAIFSVGAGGLTVRLGAGTGAGWADIENNSSWAAGATTIEFYGDPGTAFYQYSDAVFYTFAVAATFVGIPSITTFFSIEAGSLSVIDITPSGSYTTTNDAFIFNGSAIIDNSDLLDLTKIYVSEDSVFNGAQGIRAEAGTTTLPLNTYQVVRNTTQAGVGIYANIGGTIYQVREKLLADRNYYVNVGTGSDTNDGLTVGTPFETIQHAVDVVSGGLDLNVYDCTINVADGTYNEQVYCGPYMGNPPLGAVQIIGNTTTWTNCVIDCTGIYASPYAPFTVEKAGANWYIHGFRIKSDSTGGYYLLQSLSGANLIYKEIDFFGETGWTYGVEVSGGNAFEVGGCTISGGGIFHYAFYDGSVFSVYFNEVLYDGGGHSVTISTPVTFDGSFLESSVSIASFFGVSFINPGNVTGLQYRLGPGSVTLATGGLDSFPGDSPGIQLGGSTSHNNAGQITQTTQNVQNVVGTLSDGATNVALDASLSDIFHLIATMDHTILVPTNVPSVDRTQKIIIRHEASGGARTLSLTTGSAGAFRFGSDITALSATASGKTDYIGAIYNQPADRWDVVSYAKGY